MKIKFKKEYDLICIKGKRETDLMRSSVIILKDRYQEFNNKAVLEYILETILFTLPSPYRDSLQYLIHCLAYSKQSKLSVFKILAEFTNISLLQTILPFLP